MPVIHVLSPHVADLIAAGEVVERPASAVKELLENAVDAGARTVVLELRAGGRDYIRVTDDGVGMAPEDAGVCFLRHATSKLSDERGLEAIGTLGFRGEALAAISAVSRITLTTRRRGAAMGVRVEVEAGEIVSMEETGCPEGTTITVRDLFYNTPARQKFLSTDRSESAACVQSARTHAPILDCLLAQAGLSDEGRERVRRVKAGLEQLQTLPGEVLMRTIWGTLGYGGFVTERRLDPGKYFILQMLAAREPSAEAFLARLDTLRQTIRTHEDAPDALLTLSTIHSSKGLEYERVYLLDVHDGVLPSRPDAADGTEDERRVYEEDRRLFYVAMTRAKDELTLFEYPDAPSAFIREARGYLPVPVCAKDDFAAIVPENACGLRYRHETRGEGSILAQCEDELLVAFPDGDSLMQAGRMLLERSRAEVFQLPDAPAAAQLPDAQAFMPGSVIRHKKYGMGRIVSIDGPFADIRFEGETAARRFHLAQSLRSGFLFSAG